MKANSTNLIWIDLEMTGLNVDQDHIIEIAMVITDKHLNVLAESPVLAIHQPKEIMAGMDDWNTKQHRQSGLTKRVELSVINEASAEQVMLEFVSAWVPASKSPMCGNSICQDRRFLYRWMPKLEAYFHYRNLDVSTLKELAQRWQPEVAKGFKKKSKHLALSDIYDSIDELKHYRQYLFNAKIAEQGYLEAK